MSYNVFLSLAAGSALVLSIPAVAASFDFDLPAQPLSQSLRQIGSQAGVSLAFDERLVAGKSAPALKGRYDTESAVRLVLVGSGLNLDSQGAVWMIAAPSSDGLELDATTVNSSGLGETSEGTGSYTTGPMRGATKLPLTLRETPQSATVITRQRIADQAMSTLDDVVKSTPGLTVQELGPDRQRYYARGTLIDNLMYDGIPITSTGSAGESTGAGDMAIYDHVEIVRGATGLMQGAGNPSASINLVRKKPTATPQASISASAGSWDRYRTEIDVSGPLASDARVRGRLVTAYQNHQGFQDIVQNERGLFYGVIAADLGDDTVLTFGASRQEDNNNNGWGGIPVAADGSDLHLSRSTFLGNDWESYNRLYETAFVNLEQHLANDWRLNLSATKVWSELDQFTTKVFDLNQDNNFSQRLGKFWYSDHQGSYDLFASGPFQLFGRQHQLVLGLAKHDETYSYKGAPYLTLASDIDLFDWDHQAVAKGDIPYNASQSVDIEQRSVYMTSRLKLADPLTLVLGSRLDWYEYDSVYRTATSATPSAYKVNRNVTKYAGLIYDLNEHYSVYASYTDIFKPQNYRDVDGSLLEPVVGKNYEVGIKGAWFDDQLNASAAIFQMDQENRAKTTDCPADSAAGLTCYEAAGKVRSKGIDLEVQGALTPLWQIGAGYSYTENTYVKDSDAGNVGKKFDTDLPNQLFKLTTNYTLPVDGQRWRMGGTVYHQSKIYNKDQTYNISQDAYEVVDLMVGYRYDAHIQAQINLNNVFDKRYYLSITDSPIRAENVYGDPRNVMISVKYTF